ncbi:hypothetical protein K2173_012872 [Erythroxylum novogranatense]|uniref:Symplekin n=1 Tax=Erythroxylum novogranatense TaxID=1862640 RepID=A0AAV8S7K6_9ROSI|nr:hypothetical protein K2173_012872 [Erythroxylum novogranatense]
MLKFKDAVFAIALEPSSVGTRLLALKFLETYVLLFTKDTSDSEKQVLEGNRQLFNISWLVGGHALLDPSSLMSDANRTLDTLLDFLHSPGHPGSLKIAVVNCLAAIARKRPVHYDRVLSALLSFDPNSDMIKSGHSASTRYSLKTAFWDSYVHLSNHHRGQSRDRLLKALRMMNAGDAADQVIRQVDKLIRNNERASRDARYGRDDQPSSQYLVSGEQFRKRSMPLENEEPANGLEVTSKRIRYGSEAAQVNINGSERDSLLANGVSCSVPLLDSDLTPAEQVSSVIEMIGVMLGEGEQGAESLKLLISRMDPEMLADIVVTNMKHLPKSPPSLAWPVTLQIGSPSSPTQIVTPSPPINQINNHPAAQLPISAATATNSPFSDLSTTNNSPADSKRDPRRFLSLNKSRSLPIVMSDDNAPAVLTSNRTRDDKSMVDPLVSEIEHVSPKEVVCSGAEEDILTSEVNASSEIPLSPHHAVDDESAASKFSDVELGDGAEPLSSMESDQQSPVDSNKSAPEDTCQELPQLPAYVELKEDELLNVRNLSVERIVESYRNLCMVDCSQTHMALLARLIAQIGTHDELIVKLQKHILVDYRQYKGHELVMHILYHLHSLMVPDTGNSSQMTVLYDKILLEVAKSLLDAFPASDKSFSRLLGEVPLLPPSAVKLLDDLCCSDVVDSSGKEVRDGERVTQGLGAVWSLILGRPNHRQACLDIALKCAVHSQDDIRAKAVRLLNKLYQLDYITEHIEQFAVNMLLSAVNQQISDLELPQSGSIDQREGEVGNEEISVSGPQTLDTGSSENDSMRTPQLLVQSSSTISLPEAQRLISLFFALCTKKHSLLQLAFDVYGRAPKSVKQAIHRHIPILIRALRSSFSELLRIISNPPEGCENLLMLVLQVLSQEMTPSSDLINTVKHLYETKLKDATILIPILSSLSKDEVLPIFPRLVALPVEKFQMAIAHILQSLYFLMSGSAHTGPALTPAEVLVAIHDISPEKDGLALKKITDACTACFEQRTVFTQQVLAKALNQMVDQTPLPLLLMRTIIQAIDAFPSLVDFVMEILSKLVSRQVWKMPKLWVGFLKCVSQTRPHSFHVLLQLPPPQLESALTKHANLRGPLASYASQPSIRTSIARSTLAVLGLADETQKQQPHVSPV